MDVFTMIIAATLYCPKTKVFNTTEDPWNKTDKSALNTAVGTCHRRYGPKLPCLATFIKHKDQHYSALCGQKTQPDLKI